MFSLALLAVQFFIKSDAFSSSSSLPILPSRTAMRVLGPSDQLKSCFATTDERFGSLRRIVTLQQATEGGVHRRTSSTASSSSSSSSSSTENQKDDLEEVGEEVSWEDVVLPHHVDLSSKVSTWTPVSHHDDITVTDKLVLALSLSIAILLLAGLISASGPGGWRYYLAGGTCAAASHTIPVPIDVVKTRKQVDPRFKDLHFWEATWQIVQKEGMRSLLAGLGPTAWGYLLEGALKFGVYEVLKPVVKRVLVSISQTTSFLSFMNSHLVAFIVSGTISGLAAAIVLCPMEGLRIRMVAERDFAPNGWIQGGYRMLKYEGVSAMTKGIMPMIYKQVPYTVVKNVCFDYTARSAYMGLRQYGYAVTPTTKFYVPLLSAAVASVLSCLSSQPGDMLLSLVNAHGGNRRTKDIVKDILKSDRGVRGFFVGLKTRLLHVGLIVTIQLFMYDVTKRLFGIAATGSAW